MTYTSGYFLLTLTIAQSNMPITMMTSDTKLLQSLEDKFGGPVAAARAVGGPVRAVFRDPARQDRGVPGPHARVFS